MKVAYLMNSKYLWLSILCFILNIGQAQALSCMPTQGISALRQYDVVLDAIPTATGNSGNVTFKVQKAYKGRIQQGSNIVVVSQRTNFYGPKKYKQGKNYILFLKENSSSGEFNDPVCSPSFLKEAAVSFPYANQHISNNFAELELAEADSADEKIAVYNNLIEKYPHIEIFYNKIAEILMEEERFDEAVVAYQRTLKSRNSLIRKDEIGNITEKRLGPAYEDLPSYDPSIKVPTDFRWYQNGDRMNLIFPYVVALYKSGKNDDALRVLKIAEGSRDPRDIQKLRIEIEANK
ncbi:MAG: hypothetical protein DI586_08745 [Micavibrio aeruginosavorus]|uniref:Tetratricopeptide repeat protein n=1 Tax=Micavibrio aeruginosavorus TaxID=349221 RepID=A0A2W5FFT2_9BACT|nr:MAG: hypothetical protein DI586_08745 [Micavibrio aeruginosavorus]